MKRTNRNYFPHEYTAKDDPKCERLIFKMGMEGYGIFWALLEVLRAQPDYTYPLENIPLVAYKYRTESEKVRRVVFDFGLFNVVDDKIFFSNGLIRRMQPMDEEHKSRSEGGKKGMANRWKNNSVIKSANNTVDNSVSNTLNNNKNRIDKNRTDKKKLSIESKESTDKPCEGTTKRTAFVVPSPQEVKDYISEKGYTVDEKGFAAAMQEQKEKARGARKTTNYMGAEETVYQHIDPTITSKFVGYDRLTHDSKISVLTTEEEVVSALTDGQTGTIIVDETPFYATMGGQTADKGTITEGDNEFAVKDTIHLQGGRIGHVGVVTKGMFKVGDTVTLTVDAANRQNTGKNHSATHLLQKALRIVLGSHVEQAGSYVDAERLRFDFTHFSAMTDEEIAKVEAIVNEQIAKNLQVVTEEMSVEDAKKTGAMALFGEKYGDKVRVVQMKADGEEAFSVELCGGTHVANTGVISYFKIISESGVAAGVRRIEALTGDGLMKHYAMQEELLKEVAKAAKAEPAKLLQKVTSLQEELKALQSENEKLKAKLANDAVGDVDSKIQEVKGMKVLAMDVPDVDMNGLRNLGDQMKEKIGDGVVVLASANGGKVTLLAMATDAAIQKGAHAGNLIKEIASLVGGGGGGRPNMAQAGGKNPAGIPDALAKVVSVVESQLA